MDNQRTGALLGALRRERAMTQRETARHLGVSAQAVSKWERGMGCPDVALLGALAELYGVDVERILSGDLRPEDQETGNMKRTQFYVCPGCGNLLTAAGNAAVSCCGRRLEPLRPQEPDEAHRPRLEEVEDEWYLTFPHPMEREHFLRFVACVGAERVLLVRLYPEQDAALRIPRAPWLRVLACCSRHGLFDITP